MPTTRYTANAYMRDRMGCKRNNMSLSGVASLELANTFYAAMAAYSNMALLRVNHTTQQQERITGGAVTAGHFDLAGYVARLTFYNYAAEDAGDSPNTTLSIASPKDSMIHETRDGVWVVNEDEGAAIAGLIGTALGLGDGVIEFIRGAVPEN